MLRALLFDFNGVLIDDELLHHEAFTQTLVEEGFSLGREEYVSEVFGRDDRSGLRALFARRGEALDPTRETRLLARKRTYYARLLRDRSYPFRGPVVALAREAARAGRTLGVVSGAARNEVVDALGATRLDDVFEVVVTAEDVDRGKPDPEGYLLALERLNSGNPLPEGLLHPHEVAAIEDSPRGLEAARAAGLIVFGLAAAAFPSDVSSAEHVLEESDLRLASLDELAGSAQPPPPAAC